MREDLKLLVMSATIDGARVARLLGGAPVIASEGRAFPVETRYLGRDTRVPVERAAADAVGACITRGRWLGARIPSGAGGNPSRRDAPARAQSPIRRSTSSRSTVRSKGVQDRAIAPAPRGRRKVVLATSIAETSLTIEGVRIVVDGGLARVPRYEPDVGLTRFETVRVSRASADQRRGRAGRTEPGVCYRLWDEQQTASLAPASQPEILAADLSGFVLDLAHWGVADPASLAFLDPPPQAALAEAKALLTELARSTARAHHGGGRRLRQLPLPPRLARMVVDAASVGEAPIAADIALVLTERGLGGNDVDLGHRLDAFRRERSPAPEARAMARRWADTPRRSTAVPSSLRKGEEPEGSAALLALAYPEALPRAAAQRAFLLANGRGANVDRLPRSRANLISRSPKSPAPPPRAASCSPRR